MTYGFCSYYGFCEYNEATNTRLNTMNGSAVRDMTVSQYFDAMAHGKSLTNIRLFTGLFRIHTRETVRPSGRTR